MKIKYVLQLLWKIYLTCAVPTLLGQGSVIVPGIYVNPGKIGINFVDRSNAPRSSFSALDRAPSGSVGEVIFFPGEITTTSSVSVSKFPEAPYEGDANCRIEDGEAYYQNVCHVLLTSYMCSQEGHWLVISLKTGQPECEEKPCPAGQLMLDGYCVPYSDERACSYGEILYVDFAGQASCDCEPEFVYDEKVGSCLAYHQQGSCKENEYLELNNAGNAVICVPNPCPTDLQVRNPLHGKCHTKLYLGDCDEKKGYLPTFYTNGTAGCVYLYSKNIFEVPALTSCPTGSKRNHQGFCSQVLRTNPRSAFSWRVPTQYVSRFSACPPGYTRYPDGACRKVNTLLAG